MNQYLKLMSDIVNTGIDKPDRTGTGVRSVFGRQLRFDLRKGFPLVTTKKVAFRHIVEELLWFISGDTNRFTLSDKGVNIWNDWATPEGELGPIYGKQWRSWGATDTDQLGELVYNLIHRPNSRRHIISAWNVDDLPQETCSPQENAAKGKMCLAPCHCLFQFYVANGFLSCQLYQRSADLVLGVPYNIASYALLTHLLAHQCGYLPGDFVHTFGDVHIYHNHLTDDIVYEQLSRAPRALPTIDLQAAPRDVLSVKTADIVLLGYQPHPAISAPISV